jgi:hypothetical protein
MTTESELARLYRDEGQRLRDEAQADRKAAEQARQAAEYERGQAEHRLRTAASTEAGVSARERKLRDELNEPALLAREQAATKALADAKALVAEYDKAKHAAAIALQQINEREAATREKVV